jgi:MFS family permease
MIWLGVFAVAVGASYGGTVATSPVIVADAYGSAAMSSVLGMLLTANGVGALICLVGAGALIDLTGTYTLAIAAGVLLSLLSLAATLLIQPRRHNPPHETWTASRPGSAGASSASYTM